MGFLANGFINYSGFDRTAGTFNLTAQGDNITSFSATTLAAATSVPEPSSMAILGASLAAIGLIRRKKA
ncbi:MAG: PEP-CTERM sorting domain-containing protein [Oxalobacteraceae bacterium]|nr:MAG: PEP-CTERM sorting domain-containing protein [Oxalobacteraceae bacterium]